MVGNLLAHPPNLDISAQDELLSGVKKVFTEEDNHLMYVIPTKEDSLL